MGVPLSPHVCSTPQSQRETELLEKEGLLTSSPPGVQGGALGSPTYLIPFPGPCPVSFPTSEQEGEVR